eukprot:scaffold5910_cov103-Isochrysis_galbana.AAC.5
MPRASSRWSRSSPNVRLWVLARCTYPLTAFLILSSSVSAALAGALEQEGAPVDEPGVAAAVPPPSAACAGGPAPLRWSVSVSAPAAPFCSLLRSSPKS